MKILWVLMDYNEPFSGGVERTFNNMMVMLDQHEHHVWPTSLSTRRTLPKNTKKVSHPEGKYDLAIVESNGKALAQLGAVKKAAKKIIIKMQHIRRGVVDSLCNEHGPLTYFGYDYADVASTNVHPENRFYRVPPFKNTEFWLDTGREHIEGNLAIVGRVGKAKRIPEFVRAYDKTILKHSTTLTIVGGSNCSPEIQELNDTLKKANIEYTWDQKFKLDDFVRRTYMEAEVLLVTSTYETFGHQIVEALLCGTPVMTCFDHWCTSLQWFGKFLSHSENFDMLLERIGKRGYKDPRPFRQELCKTFGMKENKEWLNSIITEVANG